MQCAGFTLSIFGGVATALFLGSWASAATVPVAYGFGDRSGGALGDGYAGYELTPVHVSDQVVSVASGAAFCAYIKSDGTLWTCGENSEGQLGDGSTLHRTRPVQVASNVASVACGSEHMAFVKSDGTLWTVGSNAYGQLGDGSSVDRATPVQIASSVTSVAAGWFHTLYIKTDGTLWAFGYNGLGQLGLGNNSIQRSPVQAATGIASIAADTYFSLWVATDGRLWATGQNASGNLGDGTTTSRNLPVEVLAGVASAGAGNSHALAVKTDGTLWATGLNSSGQLGDGSTSSKTTFVQVAAGVALASGGGNFSMYLKTDGTLWATGNGAYGNLGTGMRTSRTSPILVATDVASLDTGFSYACYLKTDGSLWSVGKNDFGALGNGTSAVRAEPEPIVARVNDVISNRDQTFIIKNDASMVGTREDGWQVAGSDVSAAAIGLNHRLYVDVLGGLWGVGTNTYGQLGDGTRITRSGYVRVDQDVAEVDAGWDFSVFRKNDSTLWVTGRNNQGQLGDGSTADRDVPANLTSQVSMVSAGAYHLVYVKTDGTLWGVGGNSLGALGTGNTNNATLPVQIASGVSSASAGDYMTVFVKGDGTLWGMGQNSAQIFSSTGAYVTTPVQLAAGVSNAWAGRDHVLFLKADGTLFAMGENEYGQLGDGTNTDRPSPIQIAANILFARAGTERSFYVRNVDTPVVSVVPGSSVVPAGVPLILHANVSGEGPFQYEWFRGTSGDTTLPIPGATAYSYTTPTMERDAQYWVRVTNFAGSTDSDTVQLTVVGPVITSQPTSLTPVAGEDITLSVAAAAAGEATLTYQWYFGDTPIEGATGASLSIRSAQAFHGGSYSVAVSAGGYTTRSNAAVVSVTPAPISSARLLNLSTRALGLTGDNVLIPGFVIQGAGTKRMLVRGIGPGLHSTFGLQGVLADPQMSLMDGNRVVASNDNWGTGADAAVIAATMNAVGAFPLEAGSTDAVILIDLPAGRYTAPTIGSAAGTGIAMVELYDADVGSSTVQVVNISNRGFVDVGDHIMIPGFVVSHEGSLTVLVRAVGPGLTSTFGLQGALADPVLTVFRGEVPLLSIDDWDVGAGAETTRTVAQTVGAFPLERGSADAAFVITLPPGAYTVHARGKSGATGIALVELYLVR